MPTLQPLSQTPRFALPSLPPHPMTLRNPPEELNSSMRLLWMSATQTLPLASIFTPPGQLNSRCGAGAAERSDITTGGGQLLDAIPFAIGDVDVAGALVDRDTEGSLELSFTGAPRAVAREELALCGELLDTTVAPVSNPNIALTIYRGHPWIIELAAARSFGPELCGIDHVRAAGCGWHPLLDTLIGITAAIEITARVDRETHRLLELARTGTPIPKTDEVLPGGTELLYTIVAFIGNVEIRVVWIDGNPHRFFELARTAASATDHPPVLGIKEEKIREAVLDFLARRVFGPDRLCLLRDELANATASTWETHAGDLSRHESELRDIGRSLRVQALRLEEHEDPKHPVVVLATERIEELSTRKSGVTAAIEALKAQRPAGHHPDEIAAMLDAVPDLRKALKTASDEQLTDIFDAFDVTISYDKASQQMQLGATITPELLPQNARDRSGEQSRVLDIAGAGFEPATFGL